MSGPPTPEAARIGASPEDRDPGAPAVSIVIVVYRTPELLARTLDSVAAAGLACSWETIVVDNASSTPEGCAAVVEGRAGVRYLPNPRNVGFGRACNQGMRLARGRHILLLNPDMEVTPGSIEELLGFLEREPDVGIVAPRLDYPDGRLQESCRTFYTLKIFLLRRTFVGRLFPRSAAIRAHLMRDWDHAETRDVDWCIGAALLARREAIDDVGMMDERFFLYFEDVDWCYRMHQRGWRVVYHPASRMVHHYQRASARPWPTRGLWIHLASTFRYYEKWSFVLYWLKLRSRALRNVALFLGDALMVAVAFAAAYALRAVLSGLLTKPLFGFERYLRFLGFTLVVATSSFIGFGLYRERLRPSVLENAFPVTRALLWTAMLMMASTFLFSVRIFSRFMVVLFLPLAILLVTLGRVALLRLVRSVRARDLNLRRLAILGPPAAVEELMTRFRQHGTFGFDPVPLAAGPPSASLDDWVRRLRAERAQEVLLFEDWPGEVRGLMRKLRARGLPVRLVPALRGVLPAGSSLGEFMGWPAVLIGGEGAVFGGRGRRILDIAAAGLFGLAWLVPYLLTVGLRRLRGRAVLERVTIRGRGGRPIPVARLAGARRGRGFARAILDAYPSLGRLATGKLSLVGICPLTEEEFALCAEDYRLRPPEADPGIVGPWCVADPGLTKLEEWNRQYPQWWSAEGDFRIFWRAFFGVADGSGGGT